MKAIVIGLPKAGTSSIQRAFESLGWNSIHQAQDGFIPGPYMYRNYKKGRSILSGLEDIDAITQLDICHPNRDQDGDPLVCFPQLDMGFLRALQIESPYTRLILNRRDIVKHARSILNWGDLHQRLKQSEVLGADLEVEYWIANHYENLQKSGLTYYSVHIDSGLAEPQLRRALSLRHTTMMWWGRENPSSHHKKEN